jgi:hypothetical protein
MSIAVPSGVEALPSALRKTAPRSVASAHPYCSAKLAATAASRALLSLWDVDFVLDKNSSATRQSSAKRE